MSEYIPDGDNSLDEEPMPALDDPISIKDLAVLLHVDPSRLARRAKQERLPARKVGSTWIITLRQFVAAEAQGTTRGRRGPAPQPLPRRIQQLVDAERAAREHADDAGDAPKA